MSLSIPLPILHLPVVVAFSDADSGVTFKCRIDGDAWSTCTSPATFSGLSSGDHRVEVKAINAAGKESPVARRNFTV